MHSYIYILQVTGVSEDTSLDVRYNLSVSEDLLRLHLLHGSHGTGTVMFQCVTKFTECELSEDKSM
jgi:hypothetical protein